MTTSVVINVVIHDATSLSAHIGFVTVDVSVDRTRPNEPAPVPTDVVPRSVVATDFEEEDASPFAVEVLVSEI